jgi:deazaflavin-dependent oxidoreductase (nitroreductase family)
MPASASMSVGQRLGAFVVAMFALAFTRTLWLIRMLHPVMLALLSSSLPAGPNVLLTVRGRRSGQLRTSPVAFLDLGDRGLLQAASAEVGWVRNLRASGEAVISRGGKSRTFAASELAPEAAGAVLRDLLAPFPASRLVRRATGALDRPPIGVLHCFRIRVDEALPDYIDSARRQPVFDLRLRKTRWVR